VSYHVRYKIQGLDDLDGDVHFLSVVAEMARREFHLRSLMCIIY